MANNLPKIVLASASKQRKNLMETLGIEFEIVPSEIDEQSITDPDPLKRVVKIATAKGEAVRQLRPNAVIISADTFCVFQKKVFEKPANLGEAKKILRQFSENEVKTLTGFYYSDPRRKVYSKVITNTFMIRLLSDNEIDRYVENNPVLDWAAGYSPAYLEGMAIIDWLRGSFTAFTHGFPMEELVPQLKKSGIPV